MGKRALDQDGIERPAALPSLDELRGRIAGLLWAPPSKLARLVHAHAEKMAATTSDAASRTGASFVLMTGAFGIGRESCGRPAHFVGSGRGVNRTSSHTR